MAKTNFKTSRGGSTRQILLEEGHEEIKLKSLTVTYIHGVMLNLIDGGQPLGREIVQT